MALAPVVALAQLVPVSEQLSPGGEGMVVPLSLLLRLSHRV